MQTIEHRPVEWVNGHYIYETEVLADGPEAAEESEDVKETKSWKDYLPLMVILAVSGLTTAALQPSIAGAASMLSVMRVFMGVFLVIFSMLKFFDLPGFVKGFRMYDLGARNWKAYAYLYPFLELGLGLALLLGYQLFAVNVVLAALMFFGAAGVLLALKKGLDIHCACLGTTLKVPLSTVALVEDLGMGFMALLMLWQL